MKNLLLVLVFIIYTGTSFAQSATPPSAGDGSSGNPYLIATLDNLYWITQNSDQWDKVYQQTADIDATTSSSWDGGAGFSPIGNNTTLFTGSYDGQTHKITGLFINRSTIDDIGLFGNIGGDTIKNVWLDNVCITGRNNVGGLIGAKNSSAVINCYSNGLVTGVGDGYVGGLIGLSQSSSTTANCYSRGSVTGGGFTGGLIGYQYYSTATNCYSTDSVTGTGKIGGLIGYQYWATATNCYSNGFLTGSAISGGLTGFQYYSSISNSFWDMETSGQTNSSGGQTSSTGGTGKSSTDMRTQSTFTDDGWDFTTVWEMIGTNYPRLKAIPDPALPVELISFIATSGNSSTILVWKTATEVNNYGFEIERRTVSSDQSSVSSWGKIGFVQGSGTSNAPHNYSFTDQKLAAGTYAYRLNQMDNNGAFKYTHEAEVTVVVPKVIALSQNYPNPFNPTTNIAFSIPSNSLVTLKIFDLVGREVVTLMNETKEAGTYMTIFNLANMPSGIYFYRLQAGSFTETKKLVLLK